jgi:hypothetical protein
VLRAAGWFGLGAVAGGSLVMAAIPRAAAAIFDRIFDGPQLSEPLPTRPDERLRPA